MTQLPIADYLELAAGRLRAPAEDWAAPLRCGVDLGTATVVLAVEDPAGRPVYVDWLPERAVRDGVVVDFAAAARAVSALRRRAEELLGTPLDRAATAYPPGVGRAESRACRYVLEQAGLACTALVDEISAAHSLLRIRDGVLVDVGGGSTGVGVWRGGELVSLGDRPGGGHHLDLILAGALGISVEEAEREKRGHGGQHLSILRPGIERIAANVAAQLGPTRDLVVHLVGGALLLPGSGTIVSGWLGLPVAEYPHAQLITPFGIARCVGTATL